jgi:hypothetical protein
MGDGGIGTRSADEDGGVRGMVKDVSLMSRLGLEKNQIPFLGNYKANPCLNTPLKNPTFVEKFV